MLLDAPDRYQSKAGESIQGCLARVGGNWDNLATARRSRADLVAFVELHVEQGAILEQKGGFYWNCAGCGRNGAPKNYDYWKSQPRRNNTHGNATGCVNSGGRINFSSARNSVKKCLPNP